MRIKIKDIELALEHIKANTISESVDFEFGSDSISIILDFTDKNKNLAKAKLFDANINVTPEIISTKKLYRE